MKFLKKIFSTFFLLVSLALLIYIFYKSEIYWGGAKSSYYYTYYVFSFLLIFISIISFFINQKIKEYFIISVISIFFSFYIFEFFLIISSPHKIKKNIYEKETGKRYDTRNKIEIYQDLLKTNNEISLVLPLSNYNNQISILSGVSNSKTISCNENGYYSIYESDRYGFNNPDEEWDKKKIEYLLVGDSFTHGSCVNRPNDIASVLRSISNKPALNLGWDDNGPLEEYATLREYLGLNVKKVLWLYYEQNDLIDIERSLKNKILLNYLTDINFSQNLKSSQLDNNKLIKKIIKKTLERSKLYSLSYSTKDFFKLTNIRTKFNNYLPNKLKPLLVEKQTPNTLSVLKNVLKLSKDIVEKSNATLYFIYLPEYTRYKYNLKYDNTNYYKIKNIVNELNIHFVDIHQELFLKERNPLKLFPFELPAHYNINGYKKVAETIYKLTKN